MRDRGPAVAGCSARLQRIGPCARGDPAPGGPRRRTRPPGAVAGRRRFAACFDGRVRGRACWCFAPSALRAAFTPGVAGERFTWNIATPCAPGGRPVSRETSLRARAAMVGGRARGSAAVDDVVRGNQRSRQRDPFHVKHAGVGSALISGAAPVSPAALQSANVAHARPRRFVAKRRAGCLWNPSSSRAQGCARQCFTWNIASAALRICWTARMPATSGRVQSVPRAPRLSRPNTDVLTREAAAGSSKRGRRVRSAQRRLRNVPRETSARALRRTEQGAPAIEARSSRRPGSSVPAARAPDVDCGELWRTDGGRRWSGVAVGRRMAQDSAESRGFSALDLRLRVSASCSERQQCFPHPCGELCRDNGYEHPSRSAGADLANRAGRARLGFLHTSHPEPVARAAMFHVKHRSGRHA